MGGMERSLVSPEEMKALWRVVRSVYVMQAIGACLGLGFLHHSDRFSDVWIGVALGTMIGFIVGLCWHFSDPDRRNGEHRNALLLMGCAAVVLCVSGIALTLNPLPPGASSPIGGK